MAGLQNTRFHHWHLALPQVGVLQLAEVELCHKRPGPKHAHSGWQMVILLEGQLTLSIAAYDDDILLRPWTACLIPSRTQHAAQAEPEQPRSRFIDLHITAEQEVPLSSYVQQMQLAQVLVGDQGLLESTIATLSQLSRHHVRLPVARISATIWQLLAAFEQEPPVPKPVETGPADPRVRTADRMMREHLSNPPTMAALARAVGLSASHLRKLYLQELGEPPVKRLQALRLRAACDYLTNSVLSIKQIAQTCGFGTPSRFSRVFRAAMNQTPSRYRTEAQQHLARQR